MLGGPRCTRACAALGLVLLVTACVPASPSTTSPDGTTTDSATPAVSPSPGPAAPTPAPEGPPSGWKTFTNTSGDLSFDYPVGWTVKDPGGALTGDFVDVLNPAATLVAGLRTNIVTGSECRDKSPYEVYDAAPMLALAEAGGADGGVPRYVFESRGADTGTVATQSTVAAFGITMLPEESGDTACPMFHLFLWPPSGAFFGGTYNPESNQTPGDPSLPYLEKARLYASTPEYRDIRTMITSLRPAIGTADK